MADDAQHTIRERAYHLWVASGCKDGEADRHWLAAEREVLAAFAATAKPAPTQSPRSAVAQSAPAPKEKQRTGSKARRAAR